VTDTFDLHRDAFGELSVERSILHGAILTELFDDKPRHSQAAVVFMAGGPASGKSRLASRRELIADSVWLDVDTVREQLPEYGVWRDAGRADAATRTHREASQLVRLAFGIALARGVSVILDGVGGDDHGGFSAKIAATLARGASVGVCYATVPVELALEREQARFAETGRHVDPEILRAKHAEVSRGLDNVARLAVERIEIYDTSGSTPVLLATGRGGQGRGALEVLDATGYAAFVAKGEK
jgi:predicted kinase